MSKTIAECMTPSPHSIGQEQPLSRASEFMSKHHIRHLPVLHGGELVGVLTARDITLLEASEHIDPDKMTVEEAMSGVPYAVGPETPMAEVLQQMAERKLGSAIVMVRSEVTGIYTSTDAVAMLAELMK